MSIPAKSPLDMGSQRIHSVQDPSSAQDAATKNYVDTTAVPPHSGQVLVDFLFASGQEDDLATLTVTGQSWVTSGSIIVCSAAPVATADHDPDDYAVEGIMAVAENLVVGTGFDIRAKSCGDAGATWGKYYINWLATA